MGVTMARLTLDRLCEEASKRQRPLLVMDGNIVELQWSEPPQPQGSFGLVGDWAAVSANRIALSTRLLIPFQSDRLGWVKQQSLRLFRYDPQTRSFEKVETASIHRKRSVIHATITKPGVYGLIGMHTHPLVREAIRILCAMLSRQPGLSLPERSAFREQVCDTILCDIEESGETPPLLTRPAFPGESICDRCQGLNLEEFLDCQVLEPSRRKPCPDATWENVGPDHISGAMRQIVVDPTAHHRLYAVSANGGIWRLNDVTKYPAQRVWHPLTDTDDVNNLRFRTMAVAPSNAKVLYAANSVKELRSSPQKIYSEIYCSTYHGRHWEAIHGEGMGVVHRLVVHPANAEIVYAATSKGLWRRVTQDTWTRLFDDDCLDVELDPADSSILYLGVRAKGIFKSFTSGADWSIDPILAYSDSASGGRQAIKIALGRRGKNGRAQTRTSRTVVVRFGNEICVNNKSGEGGNSAWFRTVPVVISSNPNPPPARIDRAPVYLDGGSENRSDTDVLSNGSLVDSEWCNCLAVDPYDASHILVGSEAIIESTDGGKSWSAVRPPHEDEHSITFDPRERNLVYLAGDGGVFSSVDGGHTWPSMSLQDINGSTRGQNLAKGLITSEIRHSAVRDGRCVAVIDHTGFVLSENFTERWQFLFDGPDDSDRHGLEQTYVFSCPASVDRYYIVDRQITTKTNPNLDLVAQVNFTRSGGLVQKPTFKALSQTKVAFPAIGTYFPEDQVYLRHLPGPFAARFKNNSRLLLFAGTQAGFGFTVQSLTIRKSRPGVTQTTEAVSSDRTDPFTTITFASASSDRAFAMTAQGRLFERDFSVINGAFSAGPQWPQLGAVDFVSRLVAARWSHLQLYAMTQSQIGRLDVDDENRAWTTVYVWPETNESLISLVAHPVREGTLFAGTNKGIYLSEDCGQSWRKYRRGMPAVPITDLHFSKGYLYASTLGRGLWRCKPCPA